MRTISQKSKETLPPEELIRRRAYELYEQRGRAEGHELDDWLKAELELCEDEAQKKAA